MYYSTIDYRPLGTYFFDQIHCLATFLLIMGILEYFQIVNACVCLLIKQKYHIIRTPRINSVLLCLLVSST